MPEVLYSADLDSPVLFEQGRATVITCPIRRSGRVVEPTSGTVTITNESNAVVVAAAAVTITDEVATYTTPTFATAILGLGWRVEWSLTVAGVVREFRSSAGLVRVVPYPVVSDRSIAARVPLLDASNRGAVLSVATHQPAIEDAWKEIRRRLQRSGSRPHLIVDQDDLEEVHLLLTIARIFEGLAVARPEFLEQASRYRSEYERTWGALELTYDFGDDAVVDDPSKSAGGSLWLCGR